MVKGFSIVNEVKVDALLEFPCFFYDPMNVNNLISGFSAFSKSTLYIWNFLVRVLLNLTSSCPTDVKNINNCEVMRPETKIRKLIKSLIVTCYITSVGGKKESADLGKLSKYALKHRIHSWNKINRHVKWYLGKLGIQSL